MRHPGGEAQEVCNTHFNQGPGFCNDCPLNKVCTRHNDTAEAEYWKLMNESLKELEMKNYIKCIDNSGFEDALSNDRLYKVHAFNQQSVLVEGDNGKIRWYGMPKFQWVHVKNAV